MTENLQKTGFRESPYERPNQKWVCGWTAAGNPCPLGPTRGGACGAGDQGRCSPRMDRGRWHCTRPLVFGGPCPDGPLPDGQCCHPQPSHPICQPHRSLRAKRAYLTVAVVVLAFGALLAMLTGPSQLPFASPGPLTQAHQAIAATVSPATDCSACHQALAEADATLLSALFAERQPLDESNNCLSCHFNRDHRALHVHSADANWLQTRTARASGAGGANDPTFAMRIAALAGNPADAHDGRVACATCHHEHRGARHDLKAMSNTSCQACHARQFKALGDGHPDFTSIQRAREGISFNHANHKKTHIGPENFDCRRCHEPDQSRRVMLVKPYETSCAGCHEGGQTDHHGDAIKKITASFYQYDPEAVMPPLTLLLLAGTGDAKQAATVKRFAEEMKADPFEWSESGQVSDEEKAALRAGIEQLRKDLVAADAAVRRARLGRALDLPPDHPKVVSLTDAMSPLLFAGLAGKFDDQKADTAINYRAASHADLLITTLLDVLAANANGDAKADKSADINTFRSNLRTRVFDTYRTIPDSCLRCHSVNQASSFGSLTISWKALSRDPVSTGYARFSHDPHLPVIRQKDACIECHQLNEKVDAQENIATGGWNAHNRLQCAGCHKPAGASDSCLTCHQYHHLRP